MAKKAPSPLLLSHSLSLSQENGKESPFSSSSLSLSLSLTLSPPPLPHRSPTSTRFPKLRPINVQRGVVEAATLNESEIQWDMGLVNESYEWVERAVMFRPELRIWQFAVRTSLRTTDSLYTTWMEPRLGCRHLIRLGGNIALRIFMGSLMRVKFGWLFGPALIGSCSTPTRFLLKNLLCTGHFLTLYPARISPLWFVWMQNLLDDDARRTSNQWAGFKSAMLADIRSSTDGRTHEVTFSLTPEIFHQIFAEKPAVHRAFLNFSSKMTEKDFWTKYCRAEYLHRTKNSVVTAVEATEDEELAVFLNHDDILANEARRKILHTIRFLNF